MSKEAKEILMRHTELGAGCKVEYNITEKHILAAMEEYASQFKQDEQSDAVEFAEWLAEKHYKMIDINFTGGYWKNENPRVFKTYDLHTLFKDEQLKKK